MLIQRLAVDAAFASLHSGEQGLAAADAAARLAEFGPNRIETLAKPHLVLRLVRHFTHFLALLLWVAAILAFVAEARMPGQGLFALALAILAVIVVNGAFSFWQEYRAEATMAALQRLLPSDARVLRDGVVHSLSVESIVPGDVIVLAAGDHVPADCRLVEAFGVRVDMATLTGEARPVSRRALADDEQEDLLRCRSIVLAGTSMTAGEAKGLVFATGMRTAFGRIAHLTQTTGDAPSTLQAEIARVSRTIAILALAIGAAVFALGVVIGLPQSAAFVFAIGMIVANVPEGLLPTVTLSMAMAARRMARRNVLVRRLPSVETLGCATVICTDKTGTLTQNRMQIRSTYFPGGSLDPLPVDGGLRIDPARAARFLECAALCHDLRDTESSDGVRRRVGDPMEEALVALAERSWMQAPARTRIDEIPFDPERKRLVTVHRSDHEVLLSTKGAVEELLPRAAWVEVAARREALDAAWKDAFGRAHTAMADRGLRVLAFAYRVLPEPYDLASVETDLVLTALVGFEDPPRPEVAAAIQKCHAAGIRVVMVTGDHAHTAVAIAREIGLVTTESPRVLGGDDLRRMSDIQLQLALAAPELVCARVTADQKLRIVTALQRKRDIVAVTGDGVNDAPALRAADIGIAMGVSGTDVAREASDLVLLDDNFASIVAAVEEGRSVFANIRKFLGYILTSNVPELVPYLGFVFARMPLALTIPQILAVDLGTDLVPALGLGAEKPDPALMRQPPRSRGERLLTRGLLVRAYLFLGVAEAVAAMAAFFFVLSRGGWSWGEPLADALYRQGTTACLTAIVVMQVANVFVWRTRVRPLFGNRILALGIAVELLLIVLVDYTGVGQRLFGTAAIPLAAWLCVLPFAAAMLVLEALRRRFVRARR